MSESGSARQNGQPLVSVVVPTYGRNDRLDDALKSIAQQTYDRIELFVVDDGSPTPVVETVDVDSLDGLETVTFVRHRTNRGANVARNSGIRAASGEYVAFLDDDDRWKETKLARQVEAFSRSDPAVGLVYTGTEKRSPKGTVRTTPAIEGDAVKPLLTGAAFGQFSSVMVSADAIEAAGLPDERFPAWQDREWFFRLARHYQFKPVREPLTIRHVGLPGGITKQYELKRDVAYPLFVEKHYPFARRYGVYYARTFLASLRTKLARAAVRVGEYSDARKYFSLALVANPLYRRPYPHLAASLGGKWTYESAARARRSLKRLQSLLR